MKQTIEIEVPEGKKAVWENGKIVFEDIVIPLPTSWEDFCYKYQIKTNEASIEACSGINIFTNDYPRCPIVDRNILPSKKAAKQHRALMQLHQLRDCYRQGWEPTEDKVSFGITRRVDGRLGIDIFLYVSTSRFLSFQSAEIAQEFLKNFRDLIEQAGDLI